MAEMFLVSTLTEAMVSHSISRIADLLINEAPTLSSVREEVEVLRNVLKRIQSYLKAISKCHNHDVMIFYDDRVRNWVSEIRDLAFEIEDVTETFIVKSESSVFNPFRLRSLRRHIKSIKAKLKSCYESLKIFGIPVSGEYINNNNNIIQSTLQLRRSYLDEDDEEGDDVAGEMVGQEECLAELKARLMDDENDGWLRAVPVLGMGGIGKTTLAKKIYNDKDVKRRFEVRAWVSVSREYSARDVFAEILMQIGFSLLPAPPEEWERLKTMEEGELVKAVKGKLRGKRYLLVFDDVWRVEDFGSLRRIFPMERQGSKVVFTTRMSEVASSVDPAGVPPVLPRFLRGDESWELLHRKAFPSDVFGERKCPPEFRRMGTEMVKKCGGLPLAVVVLGGLLRTKNSEEEWKRVERDVNSHINSHVSVGGVGHMLALSYHDLPCYLKPCFLYLGSFPEDWEIPRKQLIQLWIAEGFVTTEPENQGQTVDEIAERYLRELINRCMVHIGCRSYTGDGVKTVSLHRLTRDFCVSKARSDGFSEVVQRHHETDTFPAIDKARRIAIHPGCKIDLTQIQRNIRSLMHFGLASPWSINIHRFLGSKRVRLLRVLELGFDSRSSIRKCNIPTEIGALIHLRYLGLRGGGILRLPSSIENLRSLITLNLRDNDEVSLPVEILRLKRLKHLLLPTGTSFPYGFTWLTYVLSDTTQIHTLKHIQFGTFLLKNKLVQSQLTSLRNLGVEFKSNEEVTLFLASPNFNLGTIHSLHMSLLSRVGFSGLKPLSDCSILSKLCLDGKLFRDCHTLEFLPASLTKLILRDSMIESDYDPMEALEKKLPNLRFLRLENAFIGARMACITVGGFPKLETLLLLSMDRVKEWEVGCESMPNLTRVYIKNMSNLKIPQGLKSIIIQLDN